MWVLLAAAGCTREDAPVLSVDFGADYHGSSVASWLAAGEYNLQLNCEGSNQVRFNLKSGASIVHTEQLPCSGASQYRFTLPGVAAGVSMEL